jgi:hypothetical protein
MNLLIRLADYHESLGRYKESDYVDNLMLRLSKSEDGEDLIKGVEWKNPRFKPENLQQMEAKIYPEGFHYYTDLDIPSARTMLEMIPEEDRTLENVSDSFGDALSSGTDKVIVDGEPDKFYFILELDSDKKEIEAADLTVSEENRRGNFLLALNRLYQILKPYNGWKIVCDLRHSTSWPMVKTMVQKGWITVNPGPGKKIQDVTKDESGQIMDIRTREHYLGGERMHEFKGKLNLPDTFPYQRRNN